MSLYFYKKRRARALKAETERKITLASNIVPATIVAPAEEEKEEVAPAPAPESEPEPAPKKARGRKAKAKAND